jgi:starch synthase
MICRLVAQKGLDLVEQSLPELLELGVQFVVLGRGQMRYQQFLQQAREDHPEQVGVLIDYDADMAHRIEAGSDMFLMPSQFEPCGLNQLFSLRYGTVPVCRETGGLADTVTDYSRQGLEDGEATGFLFGPDEPEALIEAVRRALAVYEDHDQWRALMRNGMAQDWSWKRSAGEYLEVYRTAQRKHKAE